MLKYIIKRLLGAVPVIFLVVTITFFLIKQAPGGPFDRDKALPAEIIENLNAVYHFNDPLYKQYFDYLVNVARFDFGPSTKYVGRSVNELIVTGLPTTFELGMYAIVVALLIGIVPGVVGALKRNTIFDYLPMSFAMIGICVPSFLLGPLLTLIFGIWLQWLPVAGWTDWTSKILPSITLGAVYAAYIARLSRGGMLEILHQDFIRTARAKGVPEKWVILKHAVRGGLLPVVSFLGPAIAGLLSGSFVVESIFQIPGLGRFYVQAAFNRDYTMIMGTTILLAVLILLFNLLSDIMVVLLNPKLSYET